MLEKYHPLLMSVHTNHPRELTTEVRDALERLANPGIPLGNQSVLLRGVNDWWKREIPGAQASHVPRPAVLPLPVRPHQRLVAPPHLRRGRVDIIEGLRGHTTGYAVPQFVIDAPGGGGKVPVNPITSCARRPGDHSQLRRERLRVSRDREREPAVRAAARVPRRVSLLVSGCHSAQSLNSWQKSISPLLSLLFAPGRHTTLLLTQSKKTP